MLQKIKEIRKELPKTGCIKLYKALNKGFLQALGIAMGRDAVFDLVRENGMLVKSRKRHVCTTNSYHRYRIHPDLVQRRHPQQAEEIWVSDKSPLSFRQTAGTTLLMNQHLPMQ